MKKIKSCKKIHICMSALIIHYIKQINKRSISIYIIRTHIHALRSFIYTPTYVVHTNIKFYGYSIHAWLVIEIVFR